MIKPINTIALLCNQHQSQSVSLVEKLFSGKMQAHNIRFIKLDWVSFEKKSSAKRLLMITEKAVDLVLVFGGDGTMMRACRLLGETGVPLLGVNHGRLGFLTDIDDSGIEKLLASLATGEYTVEKRYFLSAKITSNSHSDKKDGQKSTELLAVNDIYINKMEMHGVLEVAISVNGDFVQSLRADGLIISTPTGSTAYALSAGGPIVHPQAKGLLMLAVAPHSLTNRPIILPESSQIKLQLPSAMTGWLYADGDNPAAIDEYHQIHITSSSSSYMLAHPIGYSLYKHLRDKLHWNYAAKPPSASAK